MPPSPVSLALDGPIATITLAAPGALVDRAVMEALASAAREAAEAPAVRAVVLLGGADLAAGWSPAALAEPEGAPGLPPLGAGVEALAAIPQPVVVGIRGRAHSAGLEIALAGDIRIAAADASFALPDIAGGGLPRAGGTQRLPRAVGRAQALRLLLTGEAIGAAEAARIGLVSHVVSSAEVAGMAVALARTIAARGPIATRLAKEAVHRGAEMTLEQALRYEADLTVILQATADRAEGVRAFLEKREPHFTGE